MVRPGNPRSHTGHCYNCGEMARSSKLRFTDQTSVLVRRRRPGAVRQCRDCIRIWHRERTWRWCHRHTAWRVGTALKEHVADGRNSRCAERSVQRRRNRAYRLILPMHYRCLSISELSFELLPCGNDGKRCANGVAPIRSAHEAATTLWNRPSPLTATIPSSLKYLQSLWRG